MRQILFVFTLLLAGAAFAQQIQPQGYPPSSSQQTMPEGRTPPDQMPEGQDMATAQANASQVEQQIQQGLRAQRDLSNAKLEVRASETSVVMSGVVADQKQHKE